MTIEPAQRYPPSDDSFSEGVIAAAVEEHRRRGDVLAWFGCRPAVAELTVSVEGAQWLASARCRQRLRAGTNGEGSKPVESWLVLSAAGKGGGAGPD